MDHISARFQSFRCVFAQTGKVSRQNGRCNQKLFHPLLQTIGLSDDHRLAGNQRYSAKSSFTMLRWATLLLIVRRADTRCSCFACAYHSSVSGVSWLEISTGTSFSLES